MALARKQAVQRLTKDLREVLKFFGKPAAVQKRAYAPGKWTMREILLHLSDTEAVYLDRLRRLAAEDHAILQAFDQDKWADRLFYKTRDMKLAKQQFLTARACVIELLSKLGKTVDANTGTHSEAGPKTFAQVAETVVNHTGHHLEQLRAIAAGKTWTKS
jgi:hypothetical protein